MEITRLSDLRPRFIWDIIDDAFDLYRERFTLLLGVSAVLFIPEALLADFCYDAWARPIVNSGDRYNIYALIFFFVALPLAALMGTVRMGVVAAIVDAQMHGRAITTIGAAYRAAMKRGASLIGVGLLCALLTVLLTCIGFGIGGLWVTIVASFIAPAVVIEQRRPIGALKRSYALAASDQNRILGVLFLLGSILLVLTLGFGELTSLAMRLVPVGDATAAMRETQTELTRQGVSGLVQMTLQPLVAVAVTLLYFDLRVRRQGIDLAAQAEEHGVALAADPFGDANSDRVVREQQRRRGRPAKPRGKALT